jgi:hypothetical protein
MDPSTGGGVFYDNLPTNCTKDYCEITGNKDCLYYNDKVDLIIDNPPYSIWDKWIDHTLNLTDNFCYILGCFHFTDTRVRKRLYNGFGFTKIHFLKLTGGLVHHYCYLRKG